MDAVGWPFSRGLEGLRGSVRTASLQLAFGHEFAGAHVLETSGCPLSIFRSQGLLVEKVAVNVRTSSPGRILGEVCVTPAGPGVWVIMPELGDLSARCGFTSTLGPPLTLTLGTCVSHLKPEEREQIPNVFSL